MRIPFPKKKRNDHQEVVARLYAKLLDESTTTQEYDNVLEQLQKLDKIDTPNGRRSVSPDTLAQVGGSILGIAIIIGWEKAGNVFTSKAASFIMKR